MIAYVDTSVLIALLLREPSPPGYAASWIAADRLVSSALILPESSAAFSRAARTGRLGPKPLDDTRAALETMLGSITALSLDASLAELAAEVAEQDGLRGGDAVHLATALHLREPDFVFLTLDRDLAAAALRNGLAVAA